MCGIAGVYGWTDSSKLNEMLKCIQHRGPDQQGTYIENKLMMGARRLSIIDLSDGSQPISNEDGSVTVVFNGEIYNHTNIRDKLESKGHHFNTNCDTEVLVHLWEEYGQKMTKKLNGMFAFSIWDSEEEKLFLARDRLGIKPLYYSPTEKGFIWSSEIQPILKTDIDKEIDEKAVYNYFSLRYSPWPRTLFKNIKKVPPGTSILVEEKNGISIDRYWSLPSRDLDENPTKIVDKVRELLKKSVEKRLMSDVPLGAFLSGGLDSTAVVGIASKKYEKKLKTYSIGFKDQQVDESDKAKFVADYFNTDHKEINVDLSDMNLFSKVVEQHGEPLADPASLPTFLLSKHASEEVKTVLTGEGADELFAGYRYHRLIPRHRKSFGKLPQPIFKFSANVGDYSPKGKKYIKYFASLSSDEKAILDWSRGFSPTPERYLETSEDTESSGLNEMIRDSFKSVDSKDTLKKILSFDISHGLPDNLLYKVDQASMSASLEARVPYLDHKLVEYAYSIPSKYKTGKGEEKPILKNAVSDIVPKKILEREKHGFLVPVNRWFKEEHPAIENQLTVEKIDSTPYLEPDRVFEIWGKHKKGKRDYKMTLWKILNYTTWYHTVVR